MRTCCPAEQWDSFAVTKNASKQAGIGFESLLAARVRCLAHRSLVVMSSTDGGGVLIATSVEAAPKTSATSRSCLASCVLYSARSAMTVYIQKRQ